MFNGDLAKSKQPANKDYIPLNYKLILAGVTYFSRPFESAVSPFCPDTEEVSKIP